MDGVLVVVGVLFAKGLRDGLNMDEPPLGFIVDDVPMLEVVA